MECDSKLFGISDYCIENKILHNLTLELNTKCNLDCIHCYIPHKVSYGMSTEKVLSIIDEADALGVLNVTLTGGEIFLRDDILDIISYIRRKYMRVFLISNGTLLDRDIIRQLRALNVAELGISLYSTNESIHDHITRRTGSFRKTMSAIMCALTEGLRVVVKTPVMTKNIHTVREIRTFCNDHGIDAEFTCFITSKNNGDNSPRRFQITDKRGFLEFLVSTMDKQSFLKEVKPKNLESNLCKYCKNSIYIDSEGNVFPCNSFLIKIGNIFEDPLKSIWEESTILKKLQEAKYSDITGCSECSLGSYCSFCPGFSYLEYGDYLVCSDENKMYSECRREYHNMILKGLI